MESNTTMPTHSIDSPSQPSLTRKLVTFSTQSPQVYAIMPNSSSYFYSQEEILEMAQDAFDDSNQDMISSYPHNLDPHDTLMEQHKMEKELVLLSSSSSSGPNNNNNNNMFNMTVFPSPDATRKRSRRTPATILRPPRFGPPLLLSSEERDLKSPKMAQ